SSGAGGASVRLRAAGAGWRVHQLYRMRSWVVAVSRRIVVRSRPSQARVNTSARFSNSVGNSAWAADRPRLATRDVGTTPTATANTAAPTHFHGSEKPESSFGRRGVHWPLADGLTSVTRPPGWTQKNC